MNSVWQVITDWDRTIFLGLNSGLTNPVLNRVMPHWTDLGLSHVQGILILVIAAAIGLRSDSSTGLSLWKRIKHAVWTQRAWTGPTILAIITSGLAASSVKVLASGHRPWWYYEQEHLAGRSMDIKVRTVEGTYSLKPGMYALRVRRFPSGHTATSFGIAFALIPALRARRRRWILFAAFVFAFSIAFSRIYLASHWPLDILGGILIGAVCGPLSYQLCRAHSRRTTVSTGPDESSDARHDRERESVAGAAE